MVGHHQMMMGRGGADVVGGTGPDDVGDFVEWPKGTPHENISVAPLKRLSAPNGFHSRSINPKSERKKFDKHFWRFKNIWNALSAFGRIASQFDSCETFERHQVGILFSNNLSKKKQRCQTEKSKKTDCVSGCR